jgi:predicted O-methyltransferase YrrM
MKRHVFSLLRYRGILACDNIFKPTVRNESSHEISNDNGVRVVNFATSKNLKLKTKTLIAAFINMPGPLLMDRHTTRFIMF